MKGRHVSLAIGLVLSTTTALADAPTTPQTPSTGTTDAKYKCTVKMQATINDQARKVGFIKGQADIATFLNQSQTLSDVAKQVTSVCGNDCANIAIICKKDTSGSNAAR